MRVVTRLKRLAGIVGRIAAPLCEKFAYRLFLLVSSARLWARPQIWVSKEGMVVVEVHNFICMRLWVKVGAGHVFSISPYHTTSVFVAGLSASCSDTYVTAHAWRGVCRGEHALVCFVNAHFISSLQDRRRYPINGVCRRP